MYYTVIKTYSFGELERIIEEINRKGHKIIAMTQVNNTYTVIVEE